MRLPIAAIGLTIVVLVLSGCGDKAVIPPHYQPPPEVDVVSYLTGGERVFFDDFERSELGASWVLQRLPEEPEPQWRIEDGWVRATNTKNQGIFAKVLPTSGVVRVELLMASDPPQRGTFAGDLKIEAFNTKPEHETGYSFINGGWTNQFDTIAKLGEHSADDKRKPAQKLEPGRSYRYAVVITDDALHWFRNGSLLYTLADVSPVRGPWLGLNNWLSNARFDEVAVFKL